MAHRCTEKPDCSVYPAGLRDGEWLLDTCKFLQIIIYPWGKEEDRRDRSLSRSHRCSTLGGGGVCSLGKGL